MLATHAPAAVAPQARARQLRHAPAPAKTRQGRCRSGERKQDGNLTRLGAAGARGILALQRHTRCGRRAAPPCFNAQPRRQLHNPWRRCFPAAAAAAARAHCASSPKNICLSLLALAMMGSLGWNTTCTGGGGGIAGGGAKGGGRARAAARVRRTPAGASPPARFRTSFTLPLCPGSLYMRLRVAASHTYTKRSPLPAVTCARGGERGQQRGRRDPAPPNQCWR